MKAAAAALALGGLLALVAVGSRGGHPTGAPRLHQREVPARVGNDLLTLVVIAYTLGVLVLIAIVIAGRGEVQRPTGRTWLRRLGGLVIVLGALAFLGYEAAGGDLASRLQRNIRDAQGGGEGAKRRPTTLPDLPAARKPAEFDWIFAGVVGGGIVLAAVVVAARRRRPQPDAGDEDRDEEGIAEDLSVAVGDLIGDLRREPDPRRAVVAAYARMERVLAEHGHGRRPSEAPFEYLARILTALRVRAKAVRDLTELFERAKFSAHAIDAAAKERAIAALQTIRDDLAVRAA